MANKRKYDYDAVYEYCSEFYKQNCRPASMKDVSEAMGIPYGATVHGIFKTLEAEGHLVKIGGRYIPCWVVDLVHGNG